IPVRIIGAGDPGWRTTCHPTLTRPRVIPGLAGTGNSPHAPYAFPRQSIVGIQEPSNAVLSSGDTHNDLVFYGKRRDGNGITGGVLGDLCLPASNAGAGVERDQIGVDRADVNQIAE